jgi:uncharacterized membrane protein (UPF0127 family)
MDRPIFVHNLDRTELRVHARYCESFLARLQGFTFRRRIGPGEGLVLVEKRDSRLDTAIHMFFVWTDLAVFWINSDYEVVDRVLARSWRPAYIASRPARFVLEINPDRIGDFQIGEHVGFQDA